MIGYRYSVHLRNCLSRVQFNFYQTTMTSLLVPPPSISGQTKLDHEAFKVTLKNCPCLILPSQCINKFRGKLKKFFLKLPKFKAIQTFDTFEGKSIVYIDPRKIKDITDSFKEEITWNNIYQEKDLELTYENWHCDEVLRAILPKDIEVPTSFSQIGHIIHLNLREEQLPYKNVIGQVFLDKNHQARTVVNKIDSIDNTYRNFAMEILVGDPDTTVSVKEHGCTYNFDFSKVYWNPRLATEHVNLVGLLEPNDVLYDVFAGVGPFAIPAAKKGIRVLANDLNPASYKWLIKNAEINKVSSRLTAFNEDGRYFLRQIVKKDILDRREKNESGSEHVTMNLPALALEFLDIFSNWLNIKDLEKVCSKPLTIHVYCFIKAEKNDDFCRITKQLVKKSLNTKFSTDFVIKIRHVRNVSPNKEMMRASFLLTKELLQSEEPANKKSKLDNDNMDPNFPGNNGQK